ncbi:MAG: hypothetical protein R2748_18100 [Bryobacterales bacterium]
MINAAYKSGTNDFHVTAWEFLRNTKLNAVGFFKPRNGKPNLRAEPVRLAGGGPIVKNRAFFFADYEGLLRQSQLVFADVPTLDMRKGIMGAPVVDPYTGTPYGGDRGRFRKQRSLLSRRRSSATCPRLIAPALVRSASATTSSRCRRRCRTTTRATSRAIST